MNEIAYVAMPTSAITLLLDCVCLFIFFHTKLSIQKMQSVNSISFPFCLNTFQFQKINTKKLDKCISVCSSPSIRYIQKYVTNHQHQCRTVCLSKVQAEYMQWFTQPIRFRFFVLSSRHFFLADYYNYTHQQQNIIYYDIYVNYYFFVFPIFICCYESVQQ